MATAVITHLSDIIIDSLDSPSDPPPASSTPTTLTASSSSISLQNKPLKNTNISESKGIKYNKRRKINKKLFFYNLTS